MRKKKNPKRKKFVNKVVGELESTLVEAFG